MNVRAVKGHGTENDFVLLPDLDGAIDLTAELTRRLCDRRAGIGADGVLRVVRSENDDAARPMAQDAPYFMDYRNADGSIASMCGNGVRVFARYLQRERLIGRRGGRRHPWRSAAGVARRLQGHHGRHGRTDFSRSAAARDVRSAAGRARHRGGDP